MERATKNAKILNFSGGGRKETSKSLPEEQPAQNKKTAGCNSKRYCEVMLSEEEREIIQAFRLCDNELKRVMLCPVKVYVNKNGGYFPKAMQLWEKLQNEV